ncbi:MAG: hypothetical protein KBC64_00105 [Simkaniaceae bacterium]|nr:hypothetical protein [Simkaniaceae bacterium]
MKWIAHRGASKEKPENTLASFIQAIDIGVDFLECDVHLSQDNFPVIIHDDQIEGRLVSEMKLEELRAFQVPLLEEILALDYPMMIEIKPYNPILIQEVIQLTQEKQVVVGSFDQRVLSELKEKAPELPLIEIVDSFDACIQFPTYVALRSDQATYDVIRSLHEKGCEVWAWTVDHLKEARLLISRGIDGIITNDPRTLLSLSQHEGYSAVYRFQFHAGFTFKMATALIPYLHEMGIEAIYCSPYLQARRGSQHGYDVTEPHHLNAEVGSLEDFLLFSQTLQKYRMGHFFDLVANHMAASEENPWWVSVLDQGIKSKYARYFDINWDKYNGKIVWPILQEPLEKVEAKGLITRTRSNCVLNGRVLPLDRHFILEDFHEAAAKINYRRFFDIVDLIAVSIETQEVFDDYLHFIFELILDGHITGIRIDHPDGFFDPGTLFQRIKTAFPYLYIVIEKILAKGEVLPEEWPIDGTVGYDFLNAVTGIFVDQEKKEAMTELYHQFIGKNIDPDKQLFLAKKQFGLHSLSGELDYLLSLRPGLTLEDLITQLASMQVYRTYEVDADPFISRFQQISPVIMAKGMEDTFCYTYNRLLALNEVGGDPRNFGWSIDEFHDFNQGLLSQFPFGFTTSNTHDSKRSEEARMRLVVLSELAQEWKEQVFSWQEINKPLAPPNANMEYLIYQALLSVYEETRHEELKGRLSEYLKKAAREAKEYSSWDEINIQYEEQVDSFLKAILENKLFMEEFLPFYRKIDRLGKLNSLAALVLRLGSPGVFDLYQGREWFSYSLVDPDNRRPVDFHAPPDEKYRMMEKGLNYRKANKDLFLQGEYTPLETTGGIAFMRQWKQKAVVVVAKRFYSNEEESSVFLPYPMQLKNIFTSQECFIKSQLKEPFAAIYEVI